MHKNPFLWIHKWKLCLGWRTTLQKKSSGGKANECGWFFSSPSPSFERCWSLIHSCAEGVLCFVFFGLFVFLSLMRVAFKPCSCSHFVVRRPLLFPVLLIGNPQFVGAVCVSQSWLTGDSVHSLYFTGLPFYSQFMAVSLNPCLK